KKEKEIAANHIPKRETMMMFRDELIPVLLAGCLLAAGEIPTATAKGPAFRVRLAREVADEPVTGRVYVFLSQQLFGAPMRGPNWFRPEPCFAMNVKQLRPREAVILDDRGDGFPHVLSKLPPGQYRAQAILDHDFYATHHADGEGNFHSTIVNWTHAPPRGGELELVLDQTIKKRPFQNTTFLKEVTLKSDLLSEFHRREVVTRCVVRLPPSYYKEETRRYPVLFLIPGFGGKPTDQPRVEAKGEQEVIQVLLNGQCKWGHHVYADSATNGPRGESLVKELIPHLDDSFRTVPAPTARFLSGISSGGWSSLWLQVEYPETFGGVWSVAPDPVDFRDYQGVDLYAKPPRSLYFDERGKRPPIARRGNRPVLWYASFGKMDDVIGRGGQLRSFEAAFSPLDENGLPQKLWDRTTGRIDPQVAAAWEKYDLRLKIERNWKTLRPQLAGKIHIRMGEQDTFYLQGAAVKLAETLKTLGSDAEVTLVPNASHFDIWNEEVAAQIRRGISKAHRKHHGKGSD
ncbi:MAG: dienelactone hydrolase family protein, partial [Planctomycetales bacterium]